MATDNQRKGTPMRHALIAFVPAVVVLLIVPLPSLAMYRDGPNLYQYARSGPSQSVDPTGTTVIVTCKARGQVQAGLRTVGVSGYDLKKGAELDEYGGQGTRYRRDRGRSEIAGGMIRSGRVFKITGGNAQEASRSWETHIDARMRTIDAAKAKQFGFLAGGKPKTNPAFWSVRAHGQNGWLLIPKHGNFASIGNMWEDPGEYALACQDATTYVLLRGISLAIGRIAFDFGGGNLIKEDKAADPEDWILGDWGHIENAGFAGTVGTEGMNVIYVGSNRWWGHTRADPDYRRLEGQGSWLEEVRRWNGEVTISPMRQYPAVGLEP